MRSLHVRNGWVSTLLAVLVCLALSACSTTTAVVAAPAAPPSDDDDFSQLIVQMKMDLNRQTSRQVVAASSVAATSKSEREREFASRARALFAPLNGATLQMPVVGVQPYDLSDSWGNPRDGGRRKHKGIDIFAAKGTPVVAVADGVISYIGDQPKGGHCLWLTTEAGTAFYYAHLDRWASGLYEGIEVRSGDLLGYVGNTGNARTTPSHLHFQISDNDETVNPYPLLTRAAVVKRARAAVDSGNALGTR